MDTNWGPATPTPMSVPRYSINPHPPKNTTTTHIFIHLYIYYFIKWEVECFSNSSIWITELWLLWFTGPLKSICDVGAFKWNWLTDIKATFEVQTIHICTSVLVSETFQFH